jgi:biopolymer transport protein ExbD
MASIETAESTGGSRRSKQKKWMRKRIGFRIDMTPYVDVIMLLLTFFIMTTTLNQPQVMQINLPKGGDEETVKVDMGNVVFIRVGADGTIAVSKGKSDGTEEPPVKVGFNKIRAYLEAYGQQNKDMIMILKFDRKGKYNFMVDLLDEINRASIEKRYSFSKMDDNDEKVLQTLGG